MTIGEDQKNDALQIRASSPMAMGEAFVGLAPKQSFKTPQNEI